MVRKYQHWINGKWSPSQTEMTIDRHSPGDGSVVAVFALGSALDARRAVVAAKNEFEVGQWSQMTGMARSAALQRLAQLIDRDCEKLARIEAEESGKPIRFARGEVAWAAEITRFAATLAYQLHGNAFTNIGSALGLATREAIGVVGMIVPWNFPLVCLFQKLPFALAAGCTCVIKPSEMTSGTALEIAKLGTEAGIPAGAINVVTGPGRTVGEALANDPDIGLISFTGSTPVGTRIATAAAQRVARVALELGGKAANVVFADADLDAAVDGVLFGAVLNQGEECAAGTRLIIEESIVDDFVAELVKRAKRVRVGHPLDETADIGALIHKDHMNQVLEYIKIGQEEGADLLVGGVRLTNGDLANGFYVAPTIFCGVTPSMRIFREEIFGPILCVTTFRSTEEAIELANDTNYGLANGLWTKDIDKAHLVSKRLRSGTVYVNTYLETSPQLPFGGFKESGMGREMGLEALHEFTEVKSTYIRLGERQPALPHTIG